MPEPIRMRDFVVGGIDATGDMVQTVTPSTEGAYREDKIRRIQEGIARRRFQREHPHTGITSQFWTQTYTVERTSR
jgi:hypothetical protein